MSGYESPTPDDETTDEVAPEQIDASGTEGSQQAEKAADEALRDPAGSDEWLTLQQGAGLRHPQTHENWRVS